VKPATCTCKVSMYDPGDPENGPRLEVDVDPDESCPDHGRKADPEGWAMSDSMDRAYEASRPEAAYFAGDGEVATKPIAVWYPGERGDPSRGTLAAEIGRATIATWITLEDATKRYPEWDVRTRSSYRPRNDRPDFAAIARNLLAIIDDAPGLDDRLTDEEARVVREARQTITCECGQWPIAEYGARCPSCPPEVSR